jgi:hypothetical protein
MAKKIALLLLVAGLVAGAQAAMTFRGQEAQTVAAAKALAQRHGVDASKFIKTGAMKDALLSARAKTEEKVMKVKEQAIEMINDVKNRVNNVQSRRRESVRDEVANLLDAIEDRLQAKLKTMEAAYTENKDKANEKLADTKAKFDKEKTTGFDAIFAAGTELSAKQRQVANQKCTDRANSDRKVTKSGMSALQSTHEASRSACIDANTKVSQELESALAKVKKVSTDALADERAAEDDMDVSLAAFEKAKGQFDVGVQNQKRVTVSAQRSHKLCADQASNDKATQIKLANEGFGTAKSIVQKELALVETIRKLVDRTYGTGEKVDEATFLEMQFLFKHVKKVAAGVSAITSKVSKTVSDLKEKLLNRKEKEQAEEKAIQTAEKDAEADEKTNAANHKREEQEAARKVANELNRKINEHKANKKDSEAAKAHAHAEEDAAANAVEEKAREQKEQVVEQKVDAIKIEADAARRKLEQSEKELREATPSKSEAEIKAKIRAQAADKIKVAESKEEESQVLADEAKEKSKLEAEREAADEQEKLSEQKVKAAEAEAAATRQKKAADEQEAIRKTVDESTKKLVPVEDNTREEGETLKRLLDNVVERIQAKLDAAEAKRDADIREIELKTTVQVHKCDKQRDEAIDEAKASVATLSAASDGARSVYSTKRTILAQLKKTRIEAESAFQAESAITESRRDGANKEMVDCKQKAENAYKAGACGVLRIPEDECKESKADNMQEAENFRINAIANTARKCTNTATTVFNSQADLLQKEHKKALDLWKVAIKEADDTHTDQMNAMHSNYTDKRNMLQKEMELIDKISKMLENHARND